MSEGGRIAHNKGKQMKRKSLAERFWPKVDKRGADECWEWTASLSNGYGQINIGGAGPMLRSHRVAYELTYGTIPNGEGYHGTCVLHRCDNPKCCNPTHLFLGTNIENVRDMLTKGRGPKGESKSGSRLTIADISAIRESKARNRDLAEQYCVDPSHISRIRSGEVWR